MKIFNETLKVNHIKSQFNKKLAYFIITIGILTFPIFLIDIIFNTHMFVILFAIFVFLSVFLMIKDYIQLNNKNKNNPSNPLSKLYPINEQVCLDLVNLWETYHRTFKISKPIVINDIIFDYEIFHIINSLFEILDNQLMYMLKEQDNQTLKLLKPEDIDSYTKLYMLIIAPQEVKHLQFKIQDLHKKFIDNKSFYLLEQLEKTAQEIDEKRLNENYYFDYKEWYKNIEDWLENINDEKYLDEAAKQNYKKMIKDINK